MRKIVTAAALLAASFTSVAAEDKSSDRGLSELPSGEFTNDPAHSYIAFSYDHLGYSKPILRFGKIEATATLNSEELENSSVKVTIDPTSIDTGIAEFNERLGRDDFFDFENHNEITFESKALSFETPNTGKLEGNLTVKGVTKPITLDVTLNGAGPHPRDKVATFGISANTVLDRRDFHLGYLVPHVGAEVSVQIEVEFNQREQ